MSSLLKASRNRFPQSCQRIAASPFLHHLRFPLRVTPVQKPTLVTLPPLERPNPYLQAEAERYELMLSYTAGIREWAKHEWEHYRDGTKLLGKEISISSGLTMKAATRDSELTRRERRQLVRTSADLLRLVPFLAIVLIPAAELALPLLLKLFPNMLPSTYEKTSDAEKRRRKAIELKMQMAKVLVETSQLMKAQLLTTSASDPDTVVKLDEFDEFISAIKTDKQAEVNSEKLLKYLRLFGSDFTLSKLKREQLVAMCRLMGVSTWASDSGLRWSLKKQMKKLQADDKVIEKEGVESLNLAELHDACIARGIIPVGSSSFLRQQLRDWLDLSLRQNLPLSMLILSRAFSPTLYQTTEEALMSAVKLLPDVVVQDAKEAVGDRDPQVLTSVTVKLDVIETKTNDANLEVVADTFVAQLKTDAVLKQAQVVETASATATEQVPLPADAVAQTSVKAEVTASVTVPAGDTFEVVKSVTTPVSGPATLLPQKIELLSELADIKEVLQEAAQEAVTAASDAAASSPSSSTSGTSAAAAPVSPSSPSPSSPVAQTETPAPSLQSLATESAVKAAHEAAQSSQESSSTAEPSSAAAATAAETGNDIANLSKQLNQLVEDLHDEATPEKASAAPGAAEDAAAASSTSAPAADGAASASTPSAKPAQPSL